MGVVHEPVEDAVGQRGIADLFVPPRDRQLQGPDASLPATSLLRHHDAACPATRAARGLSCWRRGPASGRVGPTRPVLKTAP